MMTRKIPWIALALMLIFARLYVTRSAPLAVDRGVAQGLSFAEHTLMTDARKRAHHLARPGGQSPAYHEAAQVMLAPFKSSAELPLAPAKSLLGRLYGTLGVAVVKR
jgi:hypothetical protein